MRTRASLSLSLALSFVGASACTEAAGNDAADKSSKPTSAAATNTAPQPAVSVSASASSAAAALPADADPAVVSELKKFQSCNIREGFGFDFACAADEPQGFTTLAEKYVAGEGGSSDTAKVKKLAKTCLAVLSDADPKVRLAASNCLKNGFNARVDATAVDPLLTALEAEKARRRSSQARKKRSRA